MKRVSYFLFLTIRKYSVFVKPYGYEQKHHHTGITSVLTRVIRFLKGFEAIHLVKYTYSKDSTKKNKKLKKAIKERKLCT